MHGDGGLRTERLFRVERVRANGLSVLLRSGGRQPKDARKTLVLGALSVK